MKWFTLSSHLIIVFLFVFLTILPSEAKVDENARDYPPRKEQAR